VQPIEPALNPDVGLPRRPPSEFGESKSLIDRLLSGANLAKILIGAVIVLCVTMVSVTLWYGSVNDLFGRFKTLGGTVEIMTTTVGQLQKDLTAAQESIRRLQGDMASADKRLNDQRAAMDSALHDQRVALENAQQQAADVRRTLEQADSRAAESMARLDERQKGLELHMAPLPFNPPPGRR
jgi:hypothetical protein